MQIRRDVSLHLLIGTILFSLTIPQYVNAEDEETEQTLITETFNPLYGFSLEGGFGLQIGDYFTTWQQQGWIGNLLFSYYPKIFREKKFLENLSFIAELGTHGNNYKSPVTGSFLRTFIGAGVNYQQAFWRSVYFFGRGTVGAGGNMSIITNGGPGFLFNVDGYFRVAGGIGFTILQRVDAYMGISAHTSFNFAAQNIPISANFSAFAGVTAKFQQNLPKITIKKITVPNLFAPLQKYYANHNVISVKVLNDTGEKLKKVRASIYIPEYMDQPTQAKSLKLMKHNSNYTFNLPIVLSSKVLDLTDNVNLTAEIVVEYFHDDKELVRKSTQKLRIFHRNALRWNDNKKIASFITHLDPTTKAFARALSTEGRKEMSGTLHKNLVNAMAIFEGLSAHGLNYVHDPASPISGNPLSVDFIQYPRELLQEKTGDCDDLTVLFAAMLEALGMETAYLLYPGHIFMMFNTGVSAEDYQKITYDKSKLVFWSGTENTVDTAEEKETVWIPLETTLVGKSFKEAWFNAASVFKTKNDQNALTRVRTQEAFKIYPSVSLPETSLRFSMPEDFQSRITRSMNEVRNFNYEYGFQMYNARLEEDKENPEAWFEMAKLEESYGNTQEAEKAYQMANRYKKDHWYYLYYQAKFYNGIEEWGKAIGPAESALEHLPEKKQDVAHFLQLEAAIAYYGNKKYDKAKEYYEMARKGNPKYESQYSYLAIGKD